jgi:hypothetical protein
MSRLAAATLVILCAFSVQAQDAPPTPPPPPTLPVREITVFKDGHAMLLHEGELPVDPAGNVVMDGLPQPVMGSFWPYSADPKAPLGSVVAGHRTVKVERDAASVPDLIRANMGAQVTITLRSGNVFSGTLVSINGGLLLIKNLEGLRPVPLDAIDSVTIRDRSETRLSEDQVRTALTLRLDWGGQPAAKTARVGMMYLQKGIRWIPSYRIDIDGKGRATVKLQATLINELVDLDNVDAHLVVGVPSFAFKDTPDPISLQKAVATLSRYFQPESQTAYAFGNSIYSQASRSGEVRRGVDAAPAEAPNGDDTREDVFIFPVKKLSLKKGEVLVLPVTEFTVDYKDVFAVEIPMTPPRDMQGQMSGRAPSEAERLYNAPKVMHKIRLTNKTATPITTAPALILQNGRLLAQGMTTYTSVGGSSDLEITTAIDVQVKKTETEKERVPNALKWHNETFQQISLEGRACLSNYRKAPVEVEVSRVVLGEVRDAGKGMVEKLNLMEDPKGAERHNYYAWYSSWWWWNQVNPVSKITWKVTVEPGKNADLDYAWSYYWQR